MLKPLLAAVAFLALMGAPHAKELSKEELAIKAVIDESSQGWLERDLDKIMVMYNNSELMFFDLMPPLKDCCGAERGRKKLEEFFAGTVGPVTSDFRELEIHADHDMAYTTALYYFAFTSKAGKKHEINARITDVWRRIDGKWTVVHEHCSVPAKVAEWMAD
jgi:uncharacterized protein (TIGR02246 family)